MSYVLVILLGSLSSPRPAVMIPDYVNRDACERAAAELQKQIKAYSGYAVAYTFCLPHERTSS